MKHEKLNIDETLYRRALETEGFFTEDEALLLMRTISKAPCEAWLLEIGSYKGRSTLFALSVLLATQRWVIVDKFVNAAKYAGHSFLLLLSSIAQSNVSILPMTLFDAWPHLEGRRFDVVFIDADHSLLGFSQDLAVAVALCQIGGTILCHDVNEIFPGVRLIAESVVKAGVLAERERAGSLVRYEIMDRPQWLWNPAAVMPEGRA